MIGTTDATAIRVVSRRVVLSLAAVAGLLVAAHFWLLFITVTTGHDSILGLVGAFDLDRENNVPSFFSGGLFLLNAMLLWLVGQQPARHHGSRVWYALAAVFVFLSYDEMFGVHERLTRPLREAFHTGGLLYYAWVIAYVMPVIALIWWFYPTWRRLSADVRRQLLVAGCLFLLGAVVMEMINGAYDEAFGHRRSLAWGLLSAVEESLEMAGLIALAHALLGLLSSAPGGAPLVFDDRAWPLPTEQTRADL